MSAPHVTLSEAAPLADAPLVIAIDGPAAAGKGTLARELARILGLPHLDTGLLYRAAGRRVLDLGQDPAADAAAAARALQPADLARDDLRVPEVDRAASQVAGQPAVRAALLDFQRRFAAERGAVLDGRDIGTVVFPQAQVKLFLVASIACRAERRWRQNQSAASLSEVRDNLASRDAADAAREAAPLRAAPDAVIIDTDLLDPDAVLQEALRVVRARALTSSAPAD